MSNSIKDSAQAFAVNQVLKYVDSNPQEAFPKLLDWADKFDKDNLYLTQRQQIRKVMEQPDSNWMRLINSLWTDNCHRCENRIPFVVIRVVATREINSGQRVSCFR